jgi:hypothetical protein
MNKEEFNTLLSFEIDHLRSEIQRPGWTTWAITGAMAALVWVLITLVEEGGYSLRTVASLLLVIWLLHISYNFIKGYINENPPSHSSGGRFMPTYMVSANRLGIILGLAQFVFLLIVVKMFSTELGSLATIISYAAVSILLFFAFAALVVSIARFPIPLNTKNNLSSAILPIVCSILMLVSVWYHSRFLWISPGGTTVYDVRFALVIAAIFYLTSRVVSVPRGALTLDVLTSIRREFLLGRIELDIAVRQADIALVGMRASDLLENFVAKLLSLYSDISAEFNKSTALLNQMEKLQSEIKEQPLAESRDPLLVALSSSVDRVHNMLTIDIPRAYKPIKRRLIPLAFMGFLKDSNDLQQLMQKLEDTNHHLSRQSEDFRARFDKFRQTIQRDES